MNMNIKLFNYKDSVIPDSKSTCTFIFSCDSETERQKDLYRFTYIASMIP